MEQYTKIIEFFGLPGCGKTTLENYLITEGTANSWSFCRMSSLTNEYRQTSLLFKIKTFPYKSFFLLLLMSCKLPPILSLKNIRIYSSLFRIVLAYHYANNVRKKNQVIVDHGIIQSIVSILYSYPQFYKKNKKIISMFIRSICVDSYVFCSIEPLTSLRRIRQRNRTKEGRLDAIKDDSVLLQYLTNQKKQFEQLTLCLPQFFVLDMNGNTNDIAKTLLNQI